MKRLTQECRLVMKGVIIIHIFIWYFNSKSASNLNLIDIMTEYPLFSSVINRIGSGLLRHNIHPKRFKTWVENSINATGLEIVVDLQGSEPITSMVINFDWDKFREVGLARQMEGMSGHPLLKSKKVTTTNVTPNMDIEISWQFNEHIPIQVAPSKIGTQRVKVASEWMDAVTKEATEILPSEHSLSRWHVDIDGDFDGRFISQMTFITYFTIPLTSVNSLNALHLRVDRMLQVLLLTTDRMVKLAKRTLPLAS